MIEKEPVEAVRNSDSSSAVFDDLHRAGREAVLAGHHHRDVPPVDGGRWPVTITASGLSTTVLARLDDLTEQAIELAGPGHFQTGRPDAVHVTIRALEAYRDNADQQDPLVGEWTAAMDATAARHQPLRFSLDGLALTASGILAKLTPADGRPWQLMDDLQDSLGPLAWYEQTRMKRKRNIWYASLLHFGADITHPAALASWVDDQVHWPTALPVELDTLDLVRFHYRPQPRRAMVPVHWHHAPLHGGITLTAS